VPSNTILDIDNCEGGFFLYVWEPTTLRINFTGDVQVNQVVETWEEHLPSRITCDLSHLVQRIGSFVSSLQQNNPFDIRLNSEREPIIERAVVQNTVVEALSQNTSTTSSEEEFAPLTIYEITSTEENSCSSLELAVNTLKRDLDVEEPIVEIVHKRRRSL